MITIEEVPGVLRDLSARLKTKEPGGYVVSVNALCSIDGRWSMYAHVVGGPKSFTGATLDEAVEAMGRWLDTDDLALVNLTLGLTADGAMP